MLLRDRLLPFVAVESRNFWTHIVEGVFFSFGAALVQGPVFAFLMGSLRVTPRQFGFLSMFNGLAVLLPLFLAPRVERARRKKRLVWLLGLGQRLPFLVIPLLLLGCARERPVATAIAIAAVNFVAMLTVSVLVAPWMDLIAETIGGDKVGRLFGYREGTTNVFKLLSAGACTVLLAWFAFPLNYVLLYCAALVSVTISWLVFALVDEVPPAGPATSAPPGIRAYFADLADSVRSNRVFRWFLLYRAVSRVGFAALGFYAFAASQVFKAPAGYAGVYVGASSVGGAIGCFLFPRAGERWGHRPVLACGSLLHVAAAVTAALAPGPAWFVPVMLFSALGAATVTVSGAAFFLPLAPGGKRVGYITGMMAVMAPVGMAASATAGQVMQSVGHRALFLGAGVILLLGLVPLWFCRPAAGAAVKHEKENDR